MSFEVGRKCVYFLLTNTVLRCGSILQSSSPAVPTSSDAPYRRPPVPDLFPSDATHRLAWACVIVARSHECIIHSCTLILRLVSWQWCILTYYEWGCGTSISWWPHQVAVVGLWFGVHSCCDRGYGLPFLSVGNATSGSHHTIARFQ